MGNDGGQMKLTFLFAWITAVAAFAYKALTFTSAGLALANRIRVAPYQLLEASALLFLICVAQATRSLVAEQSKSGASAAGK
jgi:Sec-independent protein secretion pathway component TatC